jgi:hypothetical protein
MLLNVNEVLHIDVTKKTKLINLKIKGKQKSNFISLTKI